MGLSQLEICNQALLKVGADTIDTLTPPVSTEDGTKRSIDLCNIFFDQAYEEILRIYPWNSATKRSQIDLTAIPTTPDVVISGADATETFLNGTYTYDSDNDRYENGSYMIFKTEDIGLNKIWSLSTNPLSTTYYSAPRNDDDTYPPRTGWDTVLGAGTIPAFDYNILFGYDNYAPVPSDMIRLINCFRYKDQRDQRTAWVLEGDYILSDEDTLYVRYIAKPAATTDLEPLCTNALICNLALKLCTALQLDDNWATRINNELYGQILPQARSIDTFENKELLLEESDWIIYRNYDAPRM